MASSPRSTTAVTDHSALRSPRSTVETESIGAEVITQFQG
jgi:hypothetical protein